MRTNSHSAQTSHPRVGLAWYLAIAGAIAGAILNEAGLRIEGGALAILGFAPLYLSLERQLFPGLFFGPLTFMYLYHVLGYGMGPLGEVYILGGLEYVEQGFVPAQWGGALGLAAFAFTFHIFFRAARHWFETHWPVAKPPLPDRGWSGYVILLTILQAAVLLYGLASGANNRLGGGQADTSLGLRSLLNALSSSQGVMFFFLGYLAARRGGGWRLFWLGSLAAYSAFIILDGSRGPVAFAMIFSAMGFAWAGVPWRRVLLVGGLAAIFFIPLSGVVLNYRDLHHGPLHTDKFQ